MKFLLVDDSGTMRRIIGRTLIKLGYSDVIGAENGQEALEQLEKEDVGFVITDWNMPVMNGLKLVQNIRAGKHKHLPILMVTTNGSKDDIVQALKAGINNYVIKPMTAEDLQDKIKGMMADSSIV